MTPFSRRVSQKIQDNIINREKTKSPDNNSTEIREMITTFYRNQITDKNILKARTFGIPIKNHGKS